jgi:hypothetical protein
MRRGVWLSGEVNGELGRGRASGLAVGGGLIVLMGTVVGLLAGAGDGRDGLPSRGATSTSSQSAVSATTTSTVPVQPRASGRAVIDYEAIRRADLALFDEQHFAFVTFDGTELGRGRRDGWHTSNPNLGVDTEGSPGSWSVTEAPPLDSALPGCGTVHGAGRIRAAVCGREHGPGEIRVVAADGRSRVISRAVNPTGHWRYALPSPDGRWVLAQWSGECEVPVAYLFPAAGGPGRPVAGADRETIVIGWTPGGSAIVGFWPGACGAGTEQPGTYLVEPNTGRRRRIHAYSSGALLTPVRGYYANRLERVMQRAHRELGLPECCGQPSHGGEDAEDGFTFEGHDIAAYAAPLDEPPTPDDLRGGQLRFDCGTDWFRLSDSGPSGSTSSPAPDPDLLKRAAARLIPGLYCTAGPIRIATGAEASSAGPAP